MALGDDFESPKTSTILRVIDSFQEFHYSPHSSLILSFGCFVFPNNIHQFQVH